MSYYTELTEIISQQQKEKEGTAVFYVGEQLKDMAKRSEVTAELLLADEETGLMIRPCATHGEIIKEGKILIHCVATYAKSYAEGKTSIFFIRKISEPDIPYYTLEFKNGKVAQNRGLRN